MLEYFSKETIRPAIDQAMEEYPNESCGILLKDGRYIPTLNTANDKVSSFRIDPVVICTWQEDIAAIIHSHVDDVRLNKQGRERIVDRGHASKMDMTTQQKVRIPFGIVHLNTDGNPMKVFFWGDQLPVQDLVGRPFIHGVYDCYGLVRDFYRKEGITLKQFPRDNQWWDGEYSLVTENIEEAGFVVQDRKYEPKRGDVVLMTIRSKSINHLGVYLGDGTIIHHLCHRLSMREPLAIYIDNLVTGVARYQGDPDA